jgi:hypothetical protein
LPDEKYLETLEKCTKYTDQNKQILKDYFDEKLAELDEKKASDKEKKESIQQELKIFFNPFMYLKGTNVIHHYYAWGELLHDVISKVLK